MILENYWYVKKKMGNSNRKSQIVTKTINITPPIKHPDEHPPRITDKYFITSAKIGQGSFSKVMLGVNLETKTEVVIKVIPKDRSKDEEFTKRECEICLKLNHQYIVKYYDYFETSDFVYIVCEYCKGGELFKNIKRSDHFPEDTSKRYFVQVLSALEYLHTHFIAHRDLKSENIWLDSKGNVKLGDFGMATNVTDTRRMTQCGSLGYFAPEVIKEKVPLIGEVKQFSSNAAFGIFKVDKQRFVISPYASGFVTFSGEIIDIPKGSSVYVTVIKPDKTADQLKVRISNNNEFQAQWIIDKESQEGVYLASASYGDIASGQVGFEITKASEKIITKRIAVPEWIKNSARWWANNQISDQDFTDGLAFLIKEGTIQVEKKSVKQTTSDKIPEWIKNTARWWSEGSIGNEDFVKGIEYLIENGIIKV